MRVAQAAQNIPTTGKVTRWRAGVAVCSSVAISHFNSLVRSDGYKAAFTAGSQWAFWVCAMISVAALIATAVLIRPAELAQVETQAA